MSNDDGLYKGDVVALLRCVHDDDRVQFIKIFDSSAATAEQLIWSMGACLLGILGALNLDVDQSIRMMGLAVAKDEES